MAYLLQKSSSFKEECFIIDMFCSSECNVCLVAGIATEGALRSEAFHSPMYSLHSSKGKGGRVNVSTAICHGELSNSCASTLLPCCRMSTGMSCAAVAVPLWWEHDLLPVVSQQQWHWHKWLPPLPTWWGIFDSCCFGTRTWSQSSGCLKTAYPFPYWKLVEAFKNRPWPQCCGGMAGVRASPYHPWLDSLPFGQLDTPLQVRDYVYTS